MHSGIYFKLHNIREGLKGENSQYVDHYTYSDRKPGQDSLSCQIPWLCSNTLQKWNQTNNIPNLESENVKVRGSNKRLLIQFRSVWNRFLDCYCGPVCSVFTACSSICFLANSGAPVLQVLSSWIYSPTRIVITKSILQRGNTCRGMLRGCPGAVIRAWDTHARTDGHIHCIKECASTITSCRPSKCTRLKVTAILFTVSCCHPSETLRVRVIVRTYCVTCERTLVHAHKLWVCASVRASLFCFSLTSAHLRELFWNSWALSKQRWPNVRNGGEVDQGVHEYVSMCVCVCDFSSKLGPEGPCEKSKRRERKPSPWERQLETWRLVVLLPPAILLLLIPHLSTPVQLHLDVSACTQLPLSCLGLVLPATMPLPRGEELGEWGRVSQLVILTGHFTTVKAWDSLGQGLHVLCRVLAVLLLGCGKIINMKGWEVFWGV